MQPIDRPHAAALSSKSRICCIAPPAKSTCRTRAFGKSITCVIAAPLGPCHSCMSPLRTLRYMSSKLCLLPSRSNAGCSHFRARRMLWRGCQRCPLSVPIAHRPVRSVSTARSLFQHRFRACGCPGLRVRSPDCAALPGLGCTLQKHGAVSSTAPHLHRQPHHADPPITVCVVSHANAELPP